MIQTPSHPAPLVSIIVPIYNTGIYLNRCLKSIAEQTYCHLDIILVDDGSTDDSLGICKEFSSKDNRIRIFTQPNEGASCARNKGLDNAKGEYVMFVDSDDWIDNGMVEELSNEMTSSHASMVISDVPGDKKNFEASSPIDSHLALSHVLQGAWWGPVGKLFLRKDIGDLRFPKATISEDYVFIVELLLSLRGNVIYVPHSYYHRVTRAGSLSRLALSERKFEEFDNVSHVAQIIKENHPQFRKPAEARMAETSLKLLFAIHKNGKAKEFSHQQRMLVNSIRKNIFRYIPNNHIPFKSRMLLLMCTTLFGSKAAYQLYSKTRT